MNIAILGWGSLIWQPKDLKFNKERGWLEDGPHLPIEFARISNDGRLTLVITKEKPLIPVLYATSLYKNLDEAILDLAVREKTSKSKVGYYQKEHDNCGSVNFLFKKNITQWINDKPDIDAVIWTNLSPRFKDKIGLDLNEENVVSYLQTLPDDIKTLAEEYIRKTPPQIQTQLRVAIEEKLNWKYINPMPI
jgi:hypothetical protein